MEVETAIQKGWAWKRNVAWAIGILFVVYAVWDIVTTVPHELGWSQAFEIALLWFVLGYLSELRYRLIVTRKAA